MRTTATDLFGIEHPIFAFSHCRDVVAAVTNAGGVGVFGAARTTPEELDGELAWIRKHVGDKPFGVDLMMPAAAPRTAGRDPAPDPTPVLPGLETEFVRAMMSRYSVPELPPDVREEAAARYSNLQHAQKGHGVDTWLDVAFEHSVKLIVSALGSPPANVVQRAHDLDVAVAALAGTSRHALRHKEAGVDLVIAQGWEAGGHTGDISTMVLTPEVVDAVAPIPVLAAGGIARGRQMAAALALGAEGIWCGSVWLTTEEAETEPSILQKMLKATSRDTVRSRSLSGKPVRMLRSAWTDEWENPANPDPLPYPMQRPLIAEAYERIARAAARHEGARDLETFPVGQVVGQMTRVRSVRQVMSEIIWEYGETLARIYEEIEA